MEPRCKPPIGGDICVASRNRSGAAMIDVPRRGSRQDSLREIAWRFDTPSGLVALFAVALAARIAIAQHAGYYADLGFFHDWAVRLAKAGPRHFYLPGSDYPPGYLYVLWLIGKVSASPGFLLLKLPAILADLGLAWIAGTFAARLAPATVVERWPVRALVAAAVLFNPAVFTLSAIWGQVDALPAMFVLWSLLILLTGRQLLHRELAAALLFASAFAIKPQSGFALPVVLYALYRRHLGNRRGADLTRGTLRMLALGVCSFAFLFLTALPFGLNPFELFRFYAHSASLYAVTSANAFNFWGLVGFWRPDSGHAATSGQHVSAAGLSALHWGMLLFAAGALMVLWRAHRALTKSGQEALTLLATAASLSLFAFAVLTRMHERYVFYSLVLLAPLVVYRPLRWAFAALTTLCFLNLWWVLATFNPPGPCGLRYGGCVPIGAIFGSGSDSWQIKLWCTAVVALSLMLAWLGPRCANELKGAGETIRSAQLNLDRALRDG
jgi:dolichyl-phosphate-mannose-protein mannosyltransferase